MSLEQIKNTTNNQSQMIDDIEFDFKPITSGLGFNHQKTTEPKSIMTERSITVGTFQTIPSNSQEMNTYQNDLSIFYGQGQGPQTQISQIDEKIIEPKFYKVASKFQRSAAYLSDLLFIFSVLGLVLVLI